METVQYFNSKLKGVKIDYPLGFAPFCTKGSFCALFGKKRMDASPKKCSLWIFCITAWIATVVTSAILLSAKNKPLEYADIPATLINIYSCPTNTTDTLVGVMGYFHLTPVNPDASWVPEQYVNVTYYPCDVCDPCSFGSPPSSLTCCFNLTNVADAFIADVSYETKEVAAIGRNDGYRNTTVGQYMTDDAGQKHLIGSLIIGFSTPVFALLLAVGLVEAGCLGKKKKEGERDPLFA